MYIACWRERGRRSACRSRCCSVAERPGCGSCEHPGMMQLPRATQPTSRLQDTHATRHDPALLRHSISKRRTLIEQPAAPRWPLRSNRNLLCRALSQLNLPIPWPPLAETIRPAAELVDQDRRHPRALTMRMYSLYAYRTAN